MAEPITAKRSFQDGRVAIDVDLNVRGWGGGGVKLSARAELTTMQARALAERLLALADEADVKVEKRAASEERRKKWREREIAAGRMVMLGDLR